MKRCCMLISIALLVVTTLLGCSEQIPDETSTELTVQVAVTTDFGGDVLLDETIEVPRGTSVKDALLQVADIETKYGGGFVQSINGVQSQFPVKKDWFLYINGLSSNIGAEDYKLSDGDDILFDFHDWRFRMFIPALIGNVPEPFLHGYQGELHPTAIVYDDGFEKIARDLESSLFKLGVADISTKSTDSLTETEKQHSNLILVCTTSGSLISELNQVWEKLGYFIHFDDELITVYNSNGEVEAEYGAGYGMIQATQNPWNPSGIGVCENVVWIVSGIDEDGVNSAAEALIDHRDQLRYAYAVVIDHGEILKVPQ